MRKVYIAYGSNLNKEQMSRRCPKAKPIGKYLLNGYKLEFRGVANIIKCEDATTPVGLWEISEECEKALDRYEGYPRLYRKEYIKLQIDNEEIIGMVYVMNMGEISKPSEYYYNVIQQGYADFDIDIAPLEKALIECQNNN